MSLVYITGAPGSGKSSVRAELRRRGYIAYGGAEDGLAAFYNNQTGTKVNGWVAAESRTSAWRANHTWQINRDTLLRIRAVAVDALVYVCAITKNESQLWDLFDKVVVLKIDETTMRHRLMTRTDNDVGKAQGELQEILEQLSARVSDYPAHAVTVDATQPLAQVVDRIIELTAR